MLHTTVVRVNFWSGTYISKLLFIYATFPPYTRPPLPSPFILLLVCYYRIYIINWYNPQLSDFVPLKNGFYIYI